MTLTRPGKTDKGGVTVLILQMGKSRYGKVNLSSKGTLLVPCRKGL